jgi:phosphate-selective porin OprO and OprP
MSRHVPRSASPAVQRARAGLVLLSLVAAAPVAGEEPPTAAEVDLRLRILERNLELEAEKGAQAAKAKPAAVAGKDGFALRSADGAFQFKLRGYLQFDGRAYFDDDARPVNDAFVVRRARPVFEGTVYKIFDFKFMPDFGGGQSVLYDGYVEARFSNQVRLRAGKFKPPVGLERLQSATDLAFIERGAPTLLVPSRDLGLQLGGELADGKVEYALGLFNGVVDGGIGETTSGDDKEVAARIFWRPFQRSGEPPAVDLGIGLAATRGDQLGSPTAPQLPSYRSYGAQTFFAYRSDGTAEGTAVAAGERTRLSPQGWLYAGPFGALVEYDSSEQRVRRNLDARELENEAWQVQISWALTGERNSYKGVSPRRAFDPKGEGRGAWIVAARVSEVRIDGDAFPLFADLSRSVKRASAYGVGVSWNLAKGVRWMLDYNVTEFEGGAEVGVDRPDEKALLTRFQVAF